MTTRPTPDQNDTRAETHRRIVAILLANCWPTGLELHERQRELLIANARADGYDIPETLR